MDTTAASSRTRGWPATPFRALVAVVTLSVAMAACGGDDSGATTGAITSMPGPAADTASAAPATAEDAETSADRLTPRPAGETDSPLGYYEYLPPAYGDGEPSPLLVFLHGFGANGNGSLAELDRIVTDTGIPELIKLGDWPAERPFVVLAPQHPEAQDVAHDAQCEDTYPHGASCAMSVQHEQGHPDAGSACVTPAEVRDFLTYAIDGYDIDPERVYLTGLSCGGYGAWEYVAEHSASQVAAIVPIAGDGRPAFDGADCALGAVAIWAFHGDADDEVDPDGSSEPIASLNECESTQEAELTVYPGVDHDSWTRTYDLSAGHDIYEWLLGHSRP